MWITILSICITIIMVVPVAYWLLLSKYYYISYVTMVSGQSPRYQGCVTALHPLVWVMEQSKGSKGVKYRIVSFQRVPQRLGRKFMSFSASRSTRFHKGG